LEERIMDSERPVLVIGAAGVDIKARPQGPLRMKRSNVGVVRHSFGGVARNVAENLARLEVPTILLSAVGQDSSGDSMIAYTKQTGVDTSAILRLPDAHTGSYVAVLDAAGRLAVSISEYDVIDAITPKYVQEHRSLFADAAMIAVDANLSPKTLASIFRWAKRYGVPVCADPTSQALAVKLIDYLPELTMIAPDAGEAAALCGLDDPPSTSEAAIETAQCLVSRGVKIAIVTLGDQGLAYADSGGAGHIAALRTRVVDTTGAGDALTAAVIFGLVNEMPLDEAVRLGVSAAALTLRTRETVAKELSLDRLYDELVF
jgi:pseudouridine kinase